MPITHKALAIIFEACGFKFSYPETAREVVLDKYIELMTKVEPTVPDLFVEIVNSENEDQRRKSLDKVDNLTYSRDFVPYYARYVSTLTGMPYALIMGEGKYQELGSLNLTDLERLFWNCYRVFAQIKEEEDFSGFDIDGLRYVLPDRLMSNSTVIEFAEAAQFEAYNKDLQGGAFESLPFVIAVIARPKGEAYDSKNTMKRAALFRDRLNVYQALQVGFFLSRQSERYGNPFLSFTIARQLAQLKRARLNYRPTTVGI